MPITDSVFDPSRRRRSLFREEVRAIRRKLREEHPRYPTRADRWTGHRRWSIRRCTHYRRRRELLRCRRPLVREAIARTSRIDQRDVPSAVSSSRVSGDVPREVSPDGSHLLFGTNFGGGGLGSNTESVMAWRWHRRYRLPGRQYSGTELPYLITADACRSAWSKMFAAAFDPTLTS